MTTITKGLSWHQHFTSYASVENRNADLPDDLTGWTAKASIRDKCKAMIAELPIAVISPTTGEIQIDLTPTQTKPLPTTPLAYWSAVLTDPNGRDYILQPMEPIQIREIPSPTLP